SDDSSLEVIRSDPVTKVRPNDEKADSQSKSSATSDSRSGSGSSTDLMHSRVSEAAELNALFSLSFPIGAPLSGPVQSSGSSSALHQPPGEPTSHPPATAIPVATCVISPAAAPIVTKTTVCTTQHSTSSSITSAISTSTPGLPASSPSSNSSPNALVIGYYLGDDPVPYRSLWPSSEITLGQFKQLIPKKKGSFRYFFKKFSNEFGSGVVHQEITNDSCVLPLWEGKVVAKVERIE
ncbi:putative Axis inhibition protein axin, partial [Fasciolopsis buskii]